MTKKTSKPAPRVHTCETNGCSNAATVHPNHPGQHICEQCDRELQAFDSAVFGMTLAASG